MIKLKIYGFYQGKLSNLVLILKKKLFKFLDNQKQKYVSHYDLSDNRAYTHLHIIIALSENKYPVVGQQITWFILFPRNFEVLIVYRK